MTKLTVIVNQAEKNGVREISALKIKIEKGNPVYRYRERESSNPVGPVMVNYLVIPYRRDGNWA